MSNGKDLQSKWVGYSNGIAYDVFNVKSDNRGLCHIDGMTTLQWCTFDKIVEL